MVLAARGFQVALAGSSALVERGGVVQVAAFGRAAAAGEGAGALPDVHQVAHQLRRPVTTGLVVVGADTALDPGDLNLAEPGPDRAVSNTRAGSGAAVRDGFAVGVCERYAPFHVFPGGGEAAGEVAAVLGVQGAVSGGFAGIVRGAGPGR